MLRRISLLIFIVILVQSCYFLGPSPRKRLRLATQEKPLDVAIVPGLPLYNGQWDTLLKTRILWSVYLYKKGYVKKVLYSGNAVYTKWIEGLSMAEYAQKLGVKKEDIIIDTIAEHSKENLYYGNEIAKRCGLSSVAVASDPVQCAMLYKFARKRLDNKVYFLPVIFDSIRSDFSVNVPIDTNLNRKHNFIPIELRETPAERLKGTRGKKIK
jgi:uncharacterized SAM-binding protein YcdF (DUF218 family)